MAELVTRRHPIRGAVWGLLAGLGVFLMLTVVWPVIGLDSVTAVSMKGAIVVVAVMVVGVVWSMVAPAKRAKGPIPTTAPTGGGEEPE